MAENFTFTETGSTSGAADDIGGVKYQKIKLVDGTEDSTTPIGAGGGTEDGAIRVTIANNSTGVLSIDDGGSTITIDGSVTADVTGSGDVPITLDGEAVVLGAGTAAVGKLAANDGVDIGNVGLDAGEEHIGEVGMPDNVITITPTLDTAAYAAGDVLFNPVEIVSAVRVNAGACTLLSVHILDKADQGENFELVFLDSNINLGTINAAIDISDANAEHIIGHFSFANDYVDMINSQIRCDYGIGLELKAGVTTTSLYVAGISKGTGTYAASDLKIKLGLLRN